MKTIDTSRRAEIVKLRETGLTNAEIGRRYGITRERVRQILKGIPKPPKHNPDSKVMLRTSDAAHLLGVHVNTVRRWGNKGILRTYRICSRGDRRFKREDVESLLKEGETWREAT